MNLTLPRALLLAAAASIALAAAGAHADLDAYFKKAEPASRWEKRGEQKLDGCTVYDVHLVSQEWQGMTWQHRLQVFRPDGVQYPRFCALYNTGGGGSAGNVQMGLQMARATGATFAILYHIPNQPLFNGLTEDALVVHTWLKYLETGDSSWPLHFPMAKAVLKAMDAVQGVTRDAGHPPVSEFLISGASKRGWTAWLAGASRDPRIRAIAPMVIDVLNVRKQTPHQLEAYGKFSEQIDDYTRFDIPAKLETAAGRRLMELEDPYSYRDRLRMPKLLILGTNDRYWTQDALNLYWDGLKGPKWVLYAPNSGHGLEDRERVYATLAAFVRSTAGGSRWPKMNWAYRSTAKGAELSLRSDVPAREARLFHTRAKSKDFRESRWAYEPMQGSGSAFRAQWPAPPEGFAAIFGEAVYEIDGRPFTLSTQIRILAAPAKSASRR